MKTFMSACLAVSLSGCTSPIAPSSSVEQPLAPPVTLTRTVVDVPAVMPVMIPAPVEVVEVAPAPVVSANTPAAKPKAKVTAQKTAKPKPPEPRLTVTDDIPIDGPPCGMPNPLLPILLPPRPPTTETVLRNPFRPC